MTTTTRLGPPRQGRDAERRRPVGVAAVVPVAAWALLVLAAVGLGADLRTRTAARVGAAPFVGHVAARWGWRLVPALALAAAVVAWGPGLAERLSWRPLVALSGAASTAWAVSLNVVDGPGALTAPVATRYEYLAEVGNVGSPGRFLAGFVDNIGGYATHVRGHPPGMVVLLWALDRIGLGGAGWNTALVLAGGAAAVAAALVALREVAGTAVARAAAPFVVLVPAAVFVATSSDAFFSGVAAVGAALVVVATGRRGRRADLLAWGGGVVLGSALYLTYGAVLMLAVPAVVVTARRRARVAGAAALGALAVAFSFTGAGFWWPRGLLATRAEYLAGVASSRPYWYFLLANLAIFAVLVGPAPAAALARWRRLPHGAWWLVGGALGAVVLADLSGMSKAEVERIWLPFVPWVAVAGAALAATARRPALAAQAVTALALQVFLRSPW